MIVCHIRDLPSAGWTLGTLGIEWGPLAYTSKGWAPNVATVGTVAPFGYIVEDTDRGLDEGMPLAQIEAAKVKTKTAIPTGEYVVKFTWSNRFQCQMPLLHDVPGFRGIRVHQVKNAGWTEGCLGPALSRDVAKGSTSGGEAAVAWIYARIKECEARGEAVTWRISRVGE